MKRTFLFLLLAAAVVFGVELNATKVTNTGILIQTGATQNPVAAMTVLHQINVGKADQTEVVIANTAYTLSATPAANTTFGFTLTANSSGPYTCNLPAGTWKSSFNALTITTFQIPASTTLKQLQVTYDGSVYWLYGEPEPVGDGDVALSGKPPPLLVFTTNQTLSGEKSQVANGVTTTTSTSDVLTTGQTTTSENGFWTTGAGAWTRPAYYFHGSTSQCPVKLCASATTRAGTYAGTTWRTVNNSTVTIDTTGTTWTLSALNLTDPGNTAGILPATNGGTGLASGTSGGVPYFSGSTTMASSAALAANALMVGGGAGVAPSTTTTGTGILTALSVNTGSAGAPVLFNGAGGTPSSLGLANATGAVVAGGGTGISSATAYGTIVAGTTSTGPFQVVAPNTSGYVLTSNGASAAPTYQAASGGSSSPNSAIFTSTADKTVANTTSETSIVGTGVGSATTTANYFAAGTSLLVECSGYYSSAVADTINVKIKAGSTIVGATGAITPTTMTNSVFRVLALVTCRTVGVSGTFTVNTLLESSSGTLTANAAKILNTSTVTLDTTGTLAWDVTATWGTASASDTITGTNFTMFTPGTGSNATSTDTFTNKTYDANGTGNVLKQKGYILLSTPNFVDGTGCTVSVTATAGGFLRPAYSNSGAAASNYAIYRLSVPSDIDTSVELRARIKFVLGAADTGTQRYALSTVTQADSASSTGTPGTTINLDFAGDASGASGDVESVGYTTLTGWAATMTADRLLIVQVARDGSNAADSSTQNSTVLEIKLEYGKKSQ